jgi:uncharacterized protein YegJ (DUF2314 family)
MKNNVGRIHESCAKERKAKTQANIAIIRDICQTTLANKKDIWFKIAFVQDKTTEHMWVKVINLLDHTFTGIIDNLPLTITNVKEGEIVTMNFGEIEDYYIHLLD